MKRIEFFGPMGAGKSTIYNHYLKNSSLGNIKSSNDIINDLLLQEYKNKSFIKYMFYLIIFATPLRSKLYPLIDYYKYINNSNYNKLIEFIISTYVCQNKDDINVLRRLHLFSKELANVLIFNKFSNNIGVHDESLIQKGLAFSLSNLDEKFLELYLQKIPTSNYIIYVTSPLNVLRERVFARELNIHTKNEVDKAHQKAELIYNILKSNGEKVIRIDGTNSIKENNKILNESINFG
jgi:hypothetical protein